MHRRAGWIDLSEPLHVFAIAVLGIAALSALVSILNETELVLFESHLSTIMSSFCANWSVGLIIIAVTILVNDELHRRRIIKERKQELILRMGSPDNGFAREAVRLLQYYGWVADGSLRFAHCPNAELMRSNLQHADLTGSNFQSADLQDCNFAGAILRYVNFEHAILLGSDFTQADFRDAILTGSNMRQVNLKDAQIDNAPVPLKFTLTSGKRCLRHGASSMNVAHGQPDNTR